jgi:hypothetical protein
MKPPIYKPLVDKSISAAIAAIEVYNKPDFKYREESFSILLINSWELLVKARLVKHHRTLTCLYEFISKKKKDGIVS